MLRNDPAAGPKPTLLASHRSALRATVESGHFSPIRPPLMNECSKNSGTEYRWRPALILKRSHAQQNLISCHEPLPSTLPLGTGDAVEGYGGLPGNGRTSDPGLAKG